MNVLGHDHVRPKRHVEAISNGSHGVDDPPPSPVAPKQWQFSVAGIRQELRVPRFVPRFPRFANRRFHGRIISLSPDVENIALRAVAEGRRTCATAL
jgi:hypothetical protein